MAKSILFLISLLLIINCSKEQTSIINSDPNDSTKIDSTLLDTINKDSVDTIVVIDSNSTDTIVQDTLQTDTIVQSDTIPTDNENHAPTLSILEDSVHIFDNSGKVKVEDITITATDIENGNLIDLINFDDSKVKYTEAGTYQIYVSVKDSKGLEAKDSVFVVISKNEFAPFLVTSARTTGATPEIAIYIQNIDFENKQSYEGLTFRIYLNYPKSSFTTQASSGFQDHIEITDWGVKMNGSKGVLNLSSYYAVNGRVRDKINYITDENGVSYIEVDFPTDNEILEATDSFKYSSSLDLGGWFYFRLKLYSANSKDSALTTGWSVTSHTTPIEADSMILLDQQEISGGDIYEFTPEYYVGIFDNDSLGNERHLYGYLPK